MRKHDSRGFRHIASDSKGYSGLTALDLGNGREIVVMGTGREVELMLQEKAGKRKA